MPIRHEADFRRKPIRNWDEWVDEEIQKSQARGEFDDLPDHGKPIKLEDTPFAPEMGFALRTLKNAGYEPTWMELDRKITQGRQDLDDFLRRSAAYLQRLAAESTSPASRAPQPAPNPGWWRRFLRWITLADSTGSTEEPPITPVDLVQFRAQMRAQYLERAAVVDKLITEFHAALPRNLWHLERMRIMPDAAARAFDEGCPPVGGADPAPRP